MKRRDFLHLAVGTAVVGASRPMVAAKPQQVGPVGANNRIRSALIGAGGRGNAVARDWQLNPQTVFMATCDVDRMRIDSSMNALTERQNGAKVEGFEDYRRILDRNDVDAVLIATPDHWHSPMVIDAISAGKDVYCEKPVSNTVDAAVKMRDAARTSKRIIQIGTQQRSWGHFQEAAKLIHDGYIGNAIRHVVMYPPGGGVPAAPPTDRRTAAEMPADPIPEGFNWERFQGPAPRRPFLNARRGWRGWYAYGGGNITDWGVHLSDIMAWYMRLDGKAPNLTSASAQYVNQVKDPERTPNTYSITWQFDTFIATMSNAMPPGVEQAEENYGNWFFGDRGVMLVNRFGYDIRANRGGGRGGRGGRGQGAPAAPAQAEMEPRRVWDPNGRSEAAGTPFANATRDHVKNFLDCVRSRQKPVCDMEAGFAASLPTLLANVSIQEEKLVKWDGNRAI